MLPLFQEVLFQEEVQELFHFVEFFLRCKAAAAQQVIFKVSIF